MEQMKLNILNMVALSSSMFLTNVESVLSIIVLLTAVIYNVVKLYHQNKKRK